MNIIAFFGRWTRRQAPEPNARAEAERLLGLWGETAYDVARSLSVREKAGLLHTSTPGFWAGVVREIGHQIGVPDGPVLRASLLAHR